MQATAQPAQTWTILSLIEWAAQYLRDRGFDDPRLNVELLLCHVLHLKRIDLYTSFDRPLATGDLDQFRAAFRRRLNHEPLQYILGETEFMGVSLEVTPDVLIPRPETEELVEKALDWIRNGRTTPVDILDIGTGSGNIPIALELHSNLAHITSIDISEDALAVAARNIGRHHCTRITLSRQDVFEDVLPGRVFDMIIANPPYVSADEFACLQPEVKDFEPAIATTDGGDGLRFITRICALATGKLRPGGILLMEISYNQGHAARELAVKSGLLDVEVCRDLSGSERILQATAG